MIPAAGYMSYLKPPPTPKLALAAASKDPYGLAPNNRSGPLGVGSGAGYTQAQVDASLAANPQAAGAGGSLFTAPASAGLGAAPAAGLGAGSAAAGLGAAPAAWQGVGSAAPGPAPAPVLAPGPAPSAAAVNHYDLNTDPALQQIQSLIGLSNDQANASALKQRQNLLLAYGDKGVAESVLGAGDPIAAAAGQNPTSTVAQLAQSRDRNLKTLDDQLNAQNLGYSGYRVTQETQAGQDYQNALAQAAGGLNSNLDQVGSNLSSVLAGNNAQAEQAITDAANRASQQAIASGVDPGAIDPNALATAAGGGTDVAGGGGTPPSFAVNSQGAVNPDDPAVIAALAASQAANPQAAGAGGSLFTGQGAFAGDPTDPANEAAALARAAAAAPEPTSPAAPPATPPITAPAGDQASGSAASLASAASPVGTSSIEAIQRLLGRKMDPRFADLIG